MAFVVGECLGNVIGRLFFAKPGVAAKWTQSAACLGADGVVSFEQRLQPCTAARRSVSRAMTPSHAIVACFGS